jgi:hypothetical protein
LNHRGTHRCKDPTCAGFDRKRVFRNIAKSSAAVITVHDATPPFAYTVGLFANYTLPEMIMFMPQWTRADDVQALLFLFSVADYLATLPTVDAGTHIPAHVVGGGVDLWLWGEDSRNRARANMGIARDYYRDVHMRRIENVPVFIVSPNAHPAPRAERTELYESPRAGGIVARMLAMAEAATKDEST